MNEMTNTYNHAKVEFEILKAIVVEGEDRPVIEEFEDEILDLCEKFGLSGQSGGSAPFVANAICSALKKLLLQEVISPIAGIDQEWGTVADPVRQNKRCSAIFRNGDDQPYYLDAIVWKTQTGSTWGGYAFLGEEKITSRQCIKSFPFTPKTFYVDVIETEVAKDDWRFDVKDAKQLRAVFKYYDKFDGNKKCQI